MKKLLVALLFALGLSEAMACTSAVFQSSRTVTGDVILWKHRDQSDHRTGVRYVTGGKYAYTALTSPDGKSHFGGLNEVGFAYITNTVRNIAPSDKGGGRGVHPFTLPVTGLRECATVDEFEELVKKYVPRNKNYQAMIAVCDAKGGAAWFEVSETGYVRYDTKDTPNGYVLRSNFGFSGDDDKRGSSERRYDLMKKRLDEHMAPFKVEDFIEYSKSYVTLKDGDVLKNDDPYIDDNYSVARATSCAEFVIVTGKNPRMFMINGNPLMGMAIPVYVGKEIPECLKANGKMFQVSEQFFDKAYKKNSDGKNVLNKPLIRQLKKCTYKLQDSVEKPADLNAFNKKMDAEYDKFSKKLLKVLAKF